MLFINKMSIVIAFMFRYNISSPVTLLLLTDVAKIFIINQKEIHSVS